MPLKPSSRSDAKPLPATFPTSQGSWNSGGSHAWAPQPDHYFPAIPTLLALLAISLGTRAGGIFLFRALYIALIRR
jgi:hypothetical protein